MQWMYFDHAASTPMSEKALSVLTAAHQKAFANSAANHVMGREVAARLDGCRQLILQSLEADPALYRVVFVGSATEANNLVVQSFADGRVVGGAADHPSLVRPIRNLKDGILKDAGADLAEACAPKTALLALTHVNSQSGQILDWQKLATKTRAHCRHIHLDASQSFAKLPLSLACNLVDSLAVSAHKMGGPKGIAALVVKKDSALQPLFFGGEHEYGLRPSTVPAALALSWAQAIKDQMAVMSSLLEKTRDWNHRLRRSLESIARFPFSADESSPYILTFVLNDLPSDMVLRHLEEKKIIAASSTACSSKNQKADPTYEALGIPQKDHASVLRVSFGAGTNEAEVAGLESALLSVTKELTGLLGSSCTSRS